MAGRGPAWHLPATTVAGRGLVPVIVGSPFGSPVSLVPLTYDKRGRRPQTGCNPAMPVQ